MYIYTHCVCMCIFLRRRFSCRHSLLKMTDKDLAFSFLISLSMLANKIVKTVIGGQFKNCPK